MTRPILDPTETRTLERVRFHYEIERALADRLRHAGRTDRTTLYSAVYDELFRQVPDHPQLTRRVDAAAKNRAVEPQLHLLRRFLRPETVFLELGAGDCALTQAVAPFARQVYAVDVSAEIARLENAPANFQLIISDGTSIPVPAAGVTLVYSNQLMEHLHPEDALAQLRAVHTCLAPGGRYVCVTPNRLSGPHDISKYFDDTATGFHLKEYTTRELATLFRQAGFTRIQALHGAAGRSLLSSATPLLWLETLIAKLAPTLLRRLGRSPLFRALLGIQLVAIK